MPCTAQIVTDASLENFEQKCLMFIFTDTHFEC